jgi:hypothetical protein
VDGFNTKAHANGVHDGAYTTSYIGTGTTSYMMSYSIFGRYVASTMNEFTIDIRAVSSWNGSSSTLYINDRDSNDMRSISNMIVYEVW